MKKKNVLKISLSVIGALLLLIVCTVLFWLGPTVKMVVQRIGPKALGTDVKIEKLSINPRKGIIHLSGFTIANPDDYASSNSVSLASLDIAIDMASLFTQTVKVNQVQINSPNFVFEQSEASDNIAEYIQNVQNFIGYDPNAPIGPEEEETKRQEEEKKRKKKEEKAKKNEGKDPVIVIVDALEINDIQFHLTNSDDPSMDIAVGLDRLSVSMTNGVVELNHLQVNNPRSLASKDLFALDKVYIQLDPDTIYNAPLNIMDVDIINPHFFVEWAYDANTISEFLFITDATIQRVQQWPLPKKTNTVAEVEEQPAEQKVPPPEIYDVTVTNFQFHLVNSVYSKRTMKVQFDLLKADMSNGQIDLDNFFITNPTRLATPNLFSLDGISIKLDPASIYEKTVVLNDVAIRKPYLFLESNPQTDTVTELMKIAETITRSIPTNAMATATAKTNETAAATSSTETVDQTPSAPPIELHNLLVDDVQVRYMNTTTNSATTDQRMLAGIGSISVKLVDGKVKIDEITIPNMPGFQETNLFYLCNIDMAIEPESIFSEQIVINDIFVDSPIINMEQTKDSGNGAAIQKSLMPLIPTPKEPTDASTESVAETKPSPPIPLAEQPVILHQLQITNLAVNLTLPPQTNSVTDKAISYLNPMNLLKDEEDVETVITEENKQVDVIDRELALLDFQQLTLKPLEGLLHIDNLQLSNPSGFTDNKLVKMDYFHIDLIPDTIQSDTLIIEDITIMKPSVRYERQIRTDNLKALQTELEQAAIHRQNVLSEAPKETPAETAAVEPTTDSTNAVASAESEVSAEQQVIIQKLTIQEGMVHAKLSALPSIPVPFKLNREGIGEEEGESTSISELPSMLFNMIYDVIVDAVGSTTGVATDSLKSAGNFTMDTFGNMFDGVGNMFSGATESVGDVVKGTSDAVTGTVKKVKEKRKARRAGGRRSPLRR